MMLNQVTIMKSFDIIPPCGDKHRDAERQEGDTR